MKTARLEISIYPPASTASDSHRVDAIRADVCDAGSGELLATLESPLVVGKRFDPQHFQFDVPLLDGAKTRRVVVRSACTCPGDSNAIPSIPIEAPIEVGAETPGIADVNRVEDRRYFLPHPGRIQINSGTQAKRAAAAPQADPNTIVVEHVIATIAGGKGKASEIAAKASAAFPEEGIPLLIPSGAEVGRLARLNIRKNGPDMELVGTLSITVPPGHRKQDFPGVDRVEIELAKKGAKVKEAVIYIRSPAAASRVRSAELASV